MFPLLLISLPDVAAAAAAAATSSFTKVFLLICLQKFVSYKYHFVIHLKRSSW